MKKILFISLFFIPFVAVGISKADSVFRLDSVPEWGMNINQGWKFHAGDSRAWINPAYNDDSWQAIDPTNQIHYLPQVREAQICWFRLKLLIGPKLYGKTVALGFSQMGASEIYLDGKLIREYGKVSKDHSQEQTYDPRGEPLTIQLNDKSEHVLAVRYSYTKQNIYIGNGASVLSVGITWPQAAWGFFGNTVNYFIHRALTLGVYAILCIIQLSIYLSYRKRKISLYLSLFNFFQVCCFLNTFLGTNHDTDTFYHGLFYLTAPFTLVFYLLTVYDLFGQAKKLWFKLLIVWCVTIIPIQFFWGDPREIVMGSTAILGYLEITRIGIIAFRRKQPGSTLFLCGQVVATIFFIAFNYVAFFGININYTHFLIILDIAFLTPDVIISILLAREFAQNNISLTRQLEEVNRLSEKSLAQELEKQNLLSNQNELLERQVIERTRELNASLENLKSTQNQLIQSEKMASLGELTAGIAHEIQNPLNFVNNFSDVNREMIDELTEELRSKNWDEAVAIANDIKQNEEKINQHGKRADGIVKGMLEHSRSRSGQKEPTDINQLADEFLRLSYHGLRAKDKTFNSGMVTNFDEKLRLIKVIQQDIGRVLLNLFNNAFYAVNQKQKTAGADYKPEVSVSTSSENGQVTIKVKDNGTGIPDTIKDKIMQPFFTTKPTGEGTGLGLSLTYDMVVKGHGGNIQVNSVEGEGSEFIISLPIH